MARLRLIPLQDLMKEVADYLFRKRQLSDYERSLATVLEERCDEVGR